MIKQKYYSHFMTETGNVQESPPTLIAICVRNPGKKYQLGGPQEKDLTLRDAIVNSVKAPFKRFHRAPPPAKDFWTLKDVAFDVEQGEVVGIIGRNSVGKLTLQKILSRITAPTEGTVELHGRSGVVTYTTPLACHIYRLLPHM